MNVYFHKPGVSADVLGSILGGGRRRSRSPAVVAAIAPAAFVPIHVKRELVGQFDALAVPTPARSSAGGAHARSVSSHSQRAPSLEDSASRQQGSHSAEPVPAIDAFAAESSDDEGDGEDAAEEEGAPQRNIAVRVFFLRGVERECHVVRDPHHAYGGSYCSAT